MGATYTRQSTYADGDTITAAHTNQEFDQLLAAFQATSGHTHNGDPNEGGPVSKLLSNTLTFGSGADLDITIAFDTSGSDGELKWMHDDDRFQFSDDIMIVDDERLIFGTDSNIAVSYDETTTDSLKIAATEGAGLAITLMADEGDDAGDEWKLNIADGGTLTLGNDINSAGTYVTHLTITPNSTVANSTMAVAGNVTVGGNIDVDGTTNLDAVDIDGAVQIDSTITVGANDQGYDIIFYGDTASANVTWDTSADDLIFNGAAGLIIPEGQLTLGSTAVAATATELNILDGKAFLDEDDMSTNSATGIASQQSIKAYVDAKVTAEDLDVTSDSGTIDIDLDSETLTIAGGTGLSSSASSTTVTLAVDAAQTGITSIYATDLILGEDSQTAIDFGTVNEIDFKVDNAARLTLTSSALYPVTNNQIDLGTSSLEFKDAFFDGQVTADAFAGPLTGNVTGTADVATAVTVSDNESTNEDNVILFGAGAAGSGNIGVEADGNMTYNPSTGKITATGFIGALTGDVTGNVAGNLTGTVATATQNSITTATGLTSVGALASGSIASGFGNIDNGSSTANFGATTVDSLDVSDGNITNVGSIALDSIASDAGVGTAITLSAGIVPNTETASKSGTVAPDMSQYTNFVWTLGGNLVLDDPTDEVAGQSGVFVFIQDGTGSRTLSHADDRYFVAGGTSITLTTSANAIDIVPYFVQADGKIHLGAAQLAFAEA
jgi:hypothetical protein